MISKSKMKQIRENLKSSVPLVREQTLLIVGALEEMGMIPETQLTEIREIIHETA